MGSYIVPRKTKRRITQRKASHRGRLETAVGRPCPYCGNIMEAITYDGPPSIKFSPRAPTVDHVIPHSRGGRIRIAVCVTCNNTKGNMMPSEWLAYVAQFMPSRADAVREVFRAFKLRWQEPLLNRPEGPTQETT